MTKREIVVVILLSIFTCGIYQIYWMYVTAEEMNLGDPREPLMNYLLAILLGFVTCGIYLIYWEYKFYQKLDYITAKDNLLLCFLLSLLVSPVIGIAIAQNSINEM